MIHIVLMMVSIKVDEREDGKVHTGVGYSQYCYKLSVVRNKSYSCQKNLLPTSRMSTVSL